MNTESAFLFSGTAKWWLRILLAALLALPNYFCQISAEAASAREEEKQIDARQMRQIHAAIQAYQKKNGALPKWLSDLVPDYLPDPEVLISPVERRTGESRVFGYADPKLKCSYVYEFSDARAGGSINQNRDEPVTMREWKTMQMEEFGPAVPLLRCHLHDPVLNISFSGEVYETGLFWETDPNTYALIKKLGPGPGAKDQKTMRLRVVDVETKQPLSNVEVIASNRRTEVSPLPPRTFKTDSQGECIVGFGGTNPQSIALDFRKPGFGNAPVKWDDAEAIPEEFTVALQPAIRIGGVVREKGGQPISGVKVVVSGVVRDEAGQFLLAEYDTVETDADGKWRSDRVPKEFSALNLKLSHTEYLPAEWDEAETEEAGEGEIAKGDLLAGKAVLEMHPGIALAGTVRADSAPRAGVEVVLRDSAEPPKERRQRTDEAGRFRFVLFETGDAHLMITGEGYAPVSQAVTLQPEIAPLEIELDTGKPIRGRVFDAEENPVSGAVVAVQSWNDLQFFNWSTTTDEEGRFIWANAPEGKLVLRASKPGLITHLQPVSAGQEDEVMFRLAKTFLLSGKVVDVETGEPIPLFYLIPGRVWNAPGTDEQARWEWQSQRTGIDGAYSVDIDDRPGSPRLKYMVRADGYLPAESSVIPGRGWHTFDFKLKKGTGPKGVVKLPDGGPAEKAEVVILGTGYLNLSKQGFKNYDRAQTYLEVTDEQGRFSLPAVLPSPNLVAVHEEGYAEIPAEELEKSGEIQLRPWGRIEGVVKNGTRPAAGEMIMVAPAEPSPNTMQYDFEKYRTAADEEGRFAFTHVPPGERQLVRLLPVAGNRGWRWSHRQRIEVKAGGVTQLTYGSEGRPVIGKLQLSDANREVDWSVGHSHLSTRFPRPPGTFRSQEDWQEWYQSPEVKEAMANRRSYSFAIAADGSFRIEDVAPGTYDFNVQVMEPSERQFGYGPSIGGLRKEVEVPEAPADSPDEPFDLGSLTVEVRANNPGPTSLAR